MLSTAFGDIVPYFWHFDYFYVLYFPRFCPLIFIEFLLFERWALNLYSLYIDNDSYFRWNYNSHWHCFFVFLGYSISWFHESIWKSESIYMSEWNDNHYIPVVQRFFWISWFRVCRFSLRLSFALFSLGLSIIRSQLIFFKR